MFFSIAVKSLCKVQKAIEFWSNNSSCSNFFDAEKGIQVLMSELAVLFFQLFLTSYQESFDYSSWLKEDKYYMKKKPSVRTIKTIYGKVCYYRSYLANKKGGGGLFPLDIDLGIFQDGFSPLVMKLSTKLSTKVSFRAAVEIFTNFYLWSPSSSSIESLVLGMGKTSSMYMEQVVSCPDDGEIIVIEADGKATPTVREEELEKRKGKRNKEKKCCQRHRGKSDRNRRGKKSRRKKGDKSKNGRSITLAAIYTLKKGPDGKLHGPINKKIWGSYAPRKVMIEWAARHVKGRGFSLDSENIHVVVDGEPCLYDRLSKVFPNASFALDICHLTEKIWKVGHRFHKEGSDALSDWVEDKKDYLYTGRVLDLITELKKIKLSLSTRAKKHRKKRNALSDLIKYIESRTEMTKYKELIDQDLVIASGVIEGACRYVIGERMDCSGMRWIPDRAEALLRLRCIQINDDWDQFFDWQYKFNIEKMKRDKKLMIRQTEPDPLPTIDSFKLNVLEFKNLTITAMAA